MLAVESVAQHLQRAPQPRPHGLERYALVRGDLLWAQPVVIPPHNHGAVGLSESDERRSQIGLHFQPLLDIFDPGPRGQVLPPTSTIFSAALSQGEPAGHDGQPAAQISGLRRALNRLHERVLDHIFRRRVVPQEPLGQPPQELRVLQKRLSIGFLPIHDHHPSKPADPPQGFR